MGYAVCYSRQVFAMDFFEGLFELFFSVNVLNAGDNQGLSLPWIEIRCKYDESEKTRSVFTDKHDLASKRLIPPSHVQEIGI